MFVNNNDPQNRRKYIRVNCSQEILCHSILKDGNNEVEKFDKPLKLSMVDISLGGIGILFDTDVKDASLLECSFLLDNVQYKVLGKVSYNTPDPLGCRIGLEFLDLDKSLSEHIKRIVTKLSMTNFK